MAETPNEAVDRMKKIVAEEVDQHKAEDVDLEDVSGGWTITYSTDPPPTLSPSNPVDSSFKG